VIHAPGPDPDAALNLAARSPQRGIFRRHAASRTWNRAPQSPALSGWPSPLRHGLSLLRHPGQLRDDMPDGQPINSHGAQGG